MPPFRRRGIAAATPASAWSAAAPKPATIRPKAPTYYHNDSSDDDLDAQQTKLLADKARQMKDKLRAGNSTSKVPYGGGANSKGKGHRIGRVAAFGVSGHDDSRLGRGLSTTVVDVALGASDDDVVMNVNDIKKLSSSMKMNDDDDEAFISFVKRKITKESSAATSTPIELQPVDEASTLISRYQTHGIQSSLRTAKKDDGFDRPKSNVVGMKRARAVNDNGTTPMDGLNVELSKMTEQGIGEWLSGIIHDVEGDKAFARTLVRESEQIDHLIAEEKQECTFNIEPYMDAFDELQTLHRALSLARKHSDLNTNLLNALADEMARWTKEYNILTRGLSPLQSHEYQQLVDEQSMADHAGLFRANPDWNHLIEVVGRYKECDVKASDEFGRVRSYPGGDMSKRVDDGDDWSNDEEDSKSDVSV